MADASCPMTKWFASLLRERDKYSTFHDFRLDSDRWCGLNRNGGPVQTHFAGPLLSNCCWRQIRWRSCCCFREVDAWFLVAKAALLLFSCVVQRTSKWRDIKKRERVSERTKARDRMTLISLTAKFSNCVH